MKYTVNATKEHHYYMEVDAESPEEAEEKAKNLQREWIWMANPSLINIIDVHENRSRRLNKKEGNL